jgi:WD40 repeat protein
VTVGHPRASLVRRTADFFFGFDFFLSYAHSDGNRYPRALAAALEKRGFKVFLDEREYPAGEDLRIGTRRMVGKSRYLVLIARDYLVTREERAETNWVRQEVEACLRARRTPVVIDVNGAFSRVSPANRLRQLLPDRIFIPETADDPDGAPSERVVQKLADGFRATRQDTIRFRWISVAAAALFALAAVAGWQAWLADQRRQEAERQRDEAFSRLLTIEGRRVARDEPDAALLLAAEAVRIRSSAAAMDLLRTLLLAEPRHERFLQAGGSPWRLAAFSADGSAMVAVGEDGGIHRWRMGEDRIESQPLERADGTLASVALSPDGTRVAGGTQAGSRVLLWDARTGKLERTLDADHRGPVEGLAFSPDGAWLVSGGTATAVYLWETATGTRRAHLDQHKAGVRAVAFAPDGDRVATAAEGGRIAIWRLRESPPRHDIIDNGVPPFVFALAFSPDGRRLAAGGQGEAVVVWTLPEADAEKSAADDSEQDADQEPDEPRTPVRLTGQHAGEVTQLRFARKGTALIARGRDGRLAFYDPSGGQYLKYAPLDAGPGRRDDFAVVEDGKALLTVGPGNYVRRWTMDQPLEVAARVLPGHESGTRDVAFVGGGVLLSVGQELQQWDAEKAAPLGPAVGLDGRKVLGLGPRRDGRTVLLVLEGGDVAIWDVERQRVIQEHPRQKPQPAQSPPATAPKPAGAEQPTVLVPEGPGGKLRRAGGESPSRVCTTATTSVDAFAIAPGGVAFYFGGGSTGCVFRWTQGEGWSQQPLVEHGSYVTAIAISPNGRRIAVGGRYGGLQVQELEPNAARVAPHAFGREIRITALAFSPGGDLLLVGAGGYEAEPRKGFLPSGRTVGRAMLWHVAENRLAATIQSTPPAFAGGPVSAVGFSPDGRLAIIGGCRTEGGVFSCGRGEVVLWDVASSQQVGPPVGTHRGDVRRIAVREDGAVAATISNADAMSNDPRIVLWDLRPASWIASACNVAGRRFTPEETRRHLGNLYPDPCAPPAR